MTGGGLCAAALRKRPKRMAFKRSWVRLPSAPFFFIGFGRCQYRRATAVVSVASLKPAKKTPQDNKTPQDKKKPQGTLAGTLFRQIGKVRRWPAERVQCFADE